VITLITRDNQVLVPKGSTRLRGWDQVTVLARVVDEDLVRDALIDPFADAPGPP
jgi:cell volume regulation protein A